MVTARVSKKGQLVVPAEISKRYAIEEGVEVEFLDFGGEITLIPLPRNPIEAAEGWLISKKPVRELLFRGKAKEKELKV